MYQFPYAEVMDDVPSDARAIERRAIEHSIQLLEAAEKAGVGSRECADALLFVRRLWGALIEDLAKPENDLPKPLRADLISIGLWVFREAEQIRLEKSSNFKGIIEVSRIIWKGLQ
jgi:flagellar biosynthesis activator protein FlaF